MSTALHSLMLSRKLLRASGEDPRLLEVLMMPHAPFLSDRGGSTAPLRHVTGFPRRGRLRELRNPTGFSEPEPIAGLHPCLGSSEPARTVVGYDVGHFPLRAAGRTGAMMVVAVRWSTPPPSLLSILMLFGRKRTCFSQLPRPHTDSLWTLSLEDTARGRRRSRVRVAAPVRPGPPLPRAKVLVKSLHRLA